MEAWEQAVLTAALGAGARALEAVLSNVGVGRRKDPVRCVCGQTMRSVGLRDKQITTVLGVATFRRSLFVCPACAATCFPGDRALDMEHTGFSPGVRRMMARAGARASFIEAEEDLRVYAHVEVGRRDIERIAEDVGRQIEACTCRRSSSAAPPAAPVPVLYVSYDGTAAPMRKSELKGLKAKRPGTEPKGREVKVGCVFTQTTVDEKGFAVRDEDSTTYVAGIESSTLFGSRIYSEAFVRGLDQARRVVILSDGAAYNKTIAQTHFPDALHIIDLYHAREHLTALGETLRLPLPVRVQWSELLDAGNVEALGQAARDRLPRSGARRRSASLQVRYFEKNAARMRYADFRAQGLFVGSGVVEAGCRTVVARRLKNAGMFWSRSGAHAVLQTRCSLLSRRYDADWDDRAHQRTAPLPQSAA
jgi:hypothetical protein